MQVFKYEKNLDDIEPIIHSLNEKYAHDNPKLVSETNIIV
jgi:hypothetical protein